jgi:hypothetical protein
MIILPGDADAISFNDDTSVDGRLSRGPKIAVNAQVMRESDLDWFFRLLVLCPNMRGEIKTASVWEQFRLLCPDEKEPIWKGLSRVRIHIVDPRPYVERSKELLRVSWRRQDAPELLGKMRAEGVYGAKVLSEDLARFTADSILRDSTAVRVNDFGRVLGPILPPHPFINKLHNDGGQPIGADDFPDKPRSIIRSVTAWSAKSAAAFESALYCIEEMEEEIERCRFFPEQLIKRRMESRVLGQHAFDEGNQRHIDLLEDARSSILDTLSSSESWYLLNRRPSYPQFNSRESLFGQAADIAAGIATHVMVAHRLVGVVSKFEYVTYNGARLFRQDAEEQMRRSARE